jgi:alginate O-acetyltransferase complex protein AlgI
MFPHLVARPIVRFTQVKDDLISRDFDKNLFSFGIYRFLMGLNKKVIIANSVTILVDTSFELSASNNLNFFDAWIGIIVYAIQIYFDFSGYSDMAIGLAAMAGFHFSENFRRPYSSSSIKEFWHRWHISLSSWLRDYLYIPLGGNRVGAWSTYRNLIIVFFLCGLWHGAEITFIIWGIWHGIFLIIERFSKVKKLFQNIPSILLRCYTIFIVLTGWVFFRADNISSAIHYLKNMFKVSLSLPVLTYHSFGCIALLIGSIICLIPDKFFPEITSRKTNRLSPIIYCCHAILAILSVSFLLVRVRNPFIYFNF